MKGIAPESILVQHATIQILTDADSTGAWNSFCPRLLVITTTVEYSSHPAKDSRDLDLMLKGRAMMTRFVLMAIALSIRFSGPFSSYSRERMEVISLVPLQPCLSSWFPAEQALNKL